MKLSWFKQTGIFMKPVTIQGWMIFLAAIAFIVWSFFEIDSRSHSVSCKGPLLRRTGEMRNASGDLCEGFD